MLAAEVYDLPFDQRFICVPDFEATTIETLKSQMPELTESLDKFVAHEEEFADARVHVVPSPLKPAVACCTEQQGDKDSEDKGLDDDLDDDLDVEDEDVEDEEAGACEDYVFGAGVSD